MQRCLVAHLANLVQTFGFQSLDFLVTIPSAVLTALVLTPKSSSEKHAKNKQDRGPNLDVWRLPWEHLSWWQRSLRSLPQVGQGAKDQEPQTTNRGRAQRHGQVEGGAVTLGHSSSPGRFYTVLSWFKKAGSAMLYPVMLHVIPFSYGSLEVSNPWEYPRIIQVMDDLVINLVVKQPWWRLGINPGARGMWTAEALPGEVDAARVEGRTVWWPRGGFRKSKPTIFFWEFNVQYQMIEHNTFHIAWYQIALAIRLTILYIASHRTTYIIEVDFQAPKSGIEPPRQSKTWRFKNRTQLLGGGLINDIAIIASYFPGTMQPVWHKGVLSKWHNWLNLVPMIRGCLDVFGGHLVSDLSWRNGVEEAEERGAQEGPSREVSGVGDGKLV